MSLYEGIKTAVIYGAGQGGALTYEHLTKHGIEVVAFIDDFKSGEYFGKPIIKLEDIKNYNVDAYFIGTAHSLNRIFEWANNIFNIKNNAPVYFSLRVPAPDDYPFFVCVPPLNAISCLNLFEKNSFIDDFEIFYNFSIFYSNNCNIYFNRISRSDIDKHSHVYSYLAEKYKVNEKLEYFYPQINFDVEEGDIVFDCGASSSKDGYINCDYFAIRAGEKGRVYAFEPIPRVYNELLEDVKDFKNIRSVNMGVSDRKGFAYFEDLRMSSRISDQGNIRVELTTIDDFVKENNIEKVDFIKMDIEGAELDALKGAVNTIRTFKPKLAISIYHKPEHFYEIPQFIKSIAPEYKMWLLNNEISGGWVGTKVFCKVE